VELSQHNIAFEARRAIKAQALADFFAENANTANETSLAPMYGTCLQIDLQPEMEAVPT